MKFNRNDLAKAAQEVGLSESQMNGLWNWFVANRSHKGSLSTTLLYLGASIAFLSMSWFYTLSSREIHSVIIAALYALLFFGGSLYFWHVKKLKKFGGFLASLAVLSIPFLMYSLQRNLGFSSHTSLPQTLFSKWIRDKDAMTTLASLPIAGVILYFIRFPFIITLIYLGAALFFVDTVDVLAHPSYPLQGYLFPAMVTAMGFLLIFLGGILKKKQMKEFSFWTYFSAALLIWGGFFPWVFFSEWVYVFYLLISIAALVFSGKFHRKIFLFFGSFGIVCYAGHLSLEFVHSSLFPYMLGAVGFLILTLGAFLLSYQRKRKKVRFD